MLEYVHLKKFKSIGEEGVTLNDLSHVNYLVGANGCGKSSIMELLYIKINERATKLFMFPDAEVELNTPPQKLKYLVHNNNLMKQEYQGTAIEYTQVTTTKLNLNGLNGSGNLDGNMVSYSSQDIMNFEFTNSENKKYNNQVNVFKETQNDIIAILNSFGIDRFDEINHFNAEPELGETKRVFKLRDKNDGNHYNLDFLAGGYIYLIKLTFILSVFCEQMKNVDSLICIEEPESQLHPKFQKLLPLVFDYFTKKYNQPDGPQLKFLISTHSPFLISQASDFLDVQKVYLIDEGRCINPSGSTGGGAKKLAMEMLGAGLEDILPAKIVICESEVRSNAKDKPNYQKDAIIYQSLYGNIVNVGFYSTGSNEAVFQNNQGIQHLINLILNGQTTDVEVIGFVDNDYLAKTNNHYPTLRNTGEFNNIECFLYHKSVTDVLGLPEFTDQSIDRHAVTWFNKHIVQITAIYQNEVDWSGGRRNYWQPDFEKNVLAKAILAMKDVRGSIYWKMYDYIFRS